MIDSCDPGGERDPQTVRLEYPSVFHHKGRRLLYSGNEVGKTGFGIAVLETST
jgi:hypothetical protein